MRSGAGQGAGCGRSWGGSGPHGPRRELQAAARETLPVLRVPLGVKSLKIHLSPASPALQLSNMEGTIIVGKGAAIGPMQPSGSYKGMPIMMQNTGTSQSIWISGETTAPLIVSVDNSAVQHSSKVSLAVQHEGLNTCPTNPIGCAPFDDKASGAPNPPDSGPGDSADLAEHPVFLRFSAARPITRKSARLVGLLWMLSAGSRSMGEGAPGASPRCWGLVGCRPRTGSPGWRAFGRLPSGCSDELMSGVAGRPDRARSDLGSATKGPCRHTASAAPRPESAQNNRLGRVSGIAGVGRRSLRLGCVSLAGSAHGRRRASESGSGPAQPTASLRSPRPRGRPWGRPTALAPASLGTPSARSGRCSGWTPPRGRRRG